MYIYNAVKNNPDFSDFVLGLGIAVLAIGLFVRIIVSFCVVFGSGLTIKEQIFVALAWFPKATVQVKLIPFHSSVCKYERSLKTLCSKSRLKYISKVVNQK